MDAVFLLLNCAHKDFPSLLDQSKSELMPLFDRVLGGPKCAETNVVYRIVHRILTEQPKKLPTGSIITLSLLMSVASAKNAILNGLVKKTFEMHSSLLSDYAASTRTATLLLDALAIRIETMSCGRPNGTFYCHLDNT